MGRVAGGLLRVLSTLFYVLEFCCAAIALGIFSYFLAKLSYHHLPIEQQWRAVEGIAGAGVLYTIFALVLTVCLGAKPFFAILAVVLNLCFCGAFIAVAVLTRHGAGSCSGIVQTPIGTGFSNRDLQSGTRGSTACHLNTAVFAVSIIAAILFLISIVLQLILMKNRKNEKVQEAEKAYVADNQHKRKFWQRKPKTVNDAYVAPNGTYAANGTSNGTYAANGTHTNGTYAANGTSNGTYATNGTHTNGTYLNTGATNGGYVASDYNATH